MATFDISRVAFDPRKHYTSVRMQQGRVLTDDDWNENERIDHEEQRRSRIDIIGPYGSPDSGFLIEKPVITNGLIDFSIHEGTIHLGGLRWELDDPEMYQLQPDWLQQPVVSEQPQSMVLGQLQPTFQELATAPSPSDLPDDGSERFDLVYLEAWQQPVCAVEDESLLEVALGGPDTTTRVRTMRRVRLQTDIQTDDCAEAWETLQTRWKANQLGTINDEFERNRDVLLTVTPTATGPGDDLCSPPVAGGYLGAENQAIRVQLTDRDHFAWGFDNAAPLYRVRVRSNGTTVEIITLPKDQYHWPLAGQVVEILPWSAVLPNGQKLAAQSGYFSKVKSSYSGTARTLELTTALPAGFGKQWQNHAALPELTTPKPEEYFFLRVWNRGNDLASDPTIKLVPNTAIPLGNTGLSVSFKGDDRFVEDHWVIAARPETRDTVVPWELKTGMKPIGVRRFFAPLGIIRWTKVGGQISGEVVHDCRRKFRPLTDQECCCTFTVGDGVHSKGDFNSIAEALKNLPPDGGKICVLPGLHIANVLIRDRRHIRISGCGEQSIVLQNPSERYRKAPIFWIESSQQIQLDNLTLVTVQGTAIVVADTDANLSPSYEITIDHNRILAGIHAIQVVVQENQSGNNRIDIHDNQIGMFDQPIGKAAIFSLADEVLIERNRLVVVPAPDPDDPDDPHGKDDPKGGPYDPCFDLEKFYKKRLGLLYLIKTNLYYVNAYVPATRIKPYNAYGGIQIGSTSERVRIIRNELIGGRGNGITFGHLPDDVEGLIFTARAEVASFVQRFNSSLYEITVEENTIQQMGLSGIGVVAFFATQTVGLTIRVEDFFICRNTILRCALRLPVETLERLRAQGFMQRDIAFGGIILTTGENGVIRENRIEDNGLRNSLPVCGVFILYGDKIDISTNRIINNGPLQPTDSDGERGGIVVSMALKKAGTLLKASGPSFDGIPTVKVHDNIVSQPLGHSLFLIALGPVSVVGNQFTSMEIDPKNRFSVLAGTVFLMDLGLSKDMVLFLAQIISAQASQSISKAAYQPDLRQFLLAIQYFPNGKVLFANNQVTLDLRAETISRAFCSQLIASMDDVSFSGNQLECASLLMPHQQIFDLILLNTLLIGVSVRANDNRFIDGLTITASSLLSIGFMNTVTGNQATHCLHVLGPGSTDAETINAPLVKKNSNIVLYSDPCKSTVSGIKDRVSLRSYSYVAGH